MENIVVSSVELEDPLYPQIDDRYRPFIGTSLVSPKDIPSGINEEIYREFVRGRMVIPVKVTIKVKSLDGIKSIADEVKDLARRAIKSVEYLHKGDRGAVGTSRAVFEAPYTLRIQEDPCQVLQSIKYGRDIKIITVGFLTREK